MGTIQLLQLHYFLTVARAERSNRNYPNAVKQFRIFIPKITESSDQRGALEKEA